MLKNRYLGLPKACFEPIGAAGRIICERLSQKLITVITICFGPIFFFVSSFHFAFAESKSDLLPKGWSQAFFESDVLDDLPLRLNDDFDTDGISDMAKILVNANGEKRLFLWLNGKIIDDSGLSINIKKIAIDSFDGNKFNKESCLGGTELPKKMGIRLVDREDRDSTEIYFWSSEKKKFEKIDWVNVCPPQPIIE